MNDMPRPDEPQQGNREQGELAGQRHDAPNEPAPQGFQPPPLQAWNPGGPTTNIPQPPQPVHTPTLPYGAADGQYPAAAPAVDSGQAATSSRGMSRRGAITAWVLGLVALGLAGWGLAAGGEPGKFLQIGIQFIPLAILAALAYAGLKNTVAAVFTYIWLALLAVAVWFNDISNVFLGQVRDFNKFNDLLCSRSISSADVAQAFKPEAGAVLLATLVLLMVVTFVATAVLLRPVRVLFARIMPIDPDNFVHKIALSFIILLLLSDFVPIIVMGGQPPLLEFVKNGGGSLGCGTGGESAISVRPIDLIYQFVWTIPATFVAAGWPVLRSFRAMLKRVGFVRPTVQQVGAALALGLGLAFISNYLLDPGINQLWRAMGWGTTDTAAFGQIMSSVVSPLGAVLVGVTAGVGEELAVRGLLQPRIGLIASNLLFTSLHAFQYGFDGLLSVFIIGLILGIIRKRSNTTTSAIVHGLYDFVLVMIGFLGW